MQQSVVPTMPRFTQNDKYYRFTAIFGGKLSLDNAPIRVRKIVAHVNR